MKGSVPPKASIRALVLDKDRVLQLLDERIVFVHLEWTGRALPRLFLYIESFVL
jgi:hypothetical protein